MVLTPAHRFAVHRHSSGNCLVIWGLFLVLGFFSNLHGQDEASEDTRHPIVVKEYAGTVEVKRAGAEVWDPGYTNQVLHPGDQFRTGARSRAVIRWSNLTVTRLGERSTIRIPEEKRDGAFFQFFKGILNFMHRDKPGEFNVETPQVSAVVRETEFVLKVEEDGTTTIIMTDGRVEMTNRMGRVLLSSGEEGLARPGAAPVKTAVVVSSIDSIQWSLYYPAVLDVAELEMTLALRKDLEASLQAYESGDLLRALAAYPEGRRPGSPPEWVYRAALVLAVGQVEEGQSLLEEVEQNENSNVRTQRLSAALRRLIASVKGQASERSFKPELATEWMAESYYRQSRFDLDQALRAAGRACEVSGQFGFAWARLAELEFGFGRIQEAEEHVARALRHAPRHAPALVLQGFLASARNQPGPAIQWFEQAMAVDSALGNAWLGRGLNRIRQGRESEGVDDLQVAAVLEPQRALFRSYLGKGYSSLRDNQRALHELALAQQLDPKDPTSWLYSSLVLRQENRVNQAILDMQQAQALNENRAIYRSRLLLDQDLAVRSANLAKIYADAGLREVSLREASRAVNADYANYSGHLFLAESYRELQDPGRISLRFETPAVSEYLLANLLAPVGAGTLSPTISQQEYSKLFESDGMGIVSSSEYLSRGAWNQNGAVYGTFGDTAFSFGSSYQHDNGQRRNNDLEITSYSFQWKQQIRPTDTVFAQVLLSDGESGDRIPLYDPRDANPGLKVTEKQEPILLAGYQHEWSPGNRTLFLTGWLNDKLHVQNPQQGTALLARNNTGNLLGVRSITVDQDYESDFGAYTAEAQQILQKGSQTFVAGARYQGGEFDTDNRHAPTGGSFLPPGAFTNLTEHFQNDFERFSVYGYYQWQVADPLRLVGGLSFDYLRYPENFRYAPLEDGEDSVNQLSPKAGLVWTPTKETLVQVAYSRSLTGVSFDQSFTLEPSQVAGINQAYRNVIPGAVTGANAGESYDQVGITFQQKFSTRTFLDMDTRFIWSDVNRDLGVYDAFPPAVGVFPIPPYVFPSSTRQKLDYQEQSAGITLNQLLGDAWSVGAGYRFSHADLKVDYREISGGVPAFGGFESHQDLEAYLHHVKLFGVFNHPSGIFGQAQSHWFQQSNQGYSVDLPGDDFWQIHLFGGYRFLQRRAEVTLGVLNVFDQNYRLNPLSLTPDLPRERTFMARFRISF